MAADDFEYQPGDTGAERLAESAEQAGPGDGLKARLEGHVEWKGHGEALSNIVHKECHEHIEAELRVGMVCRIGDEAFGKFVQSNGDDRLQAYGKEGVGGHVMMVRLGFKVFRHLVTGIVLILGVVVCVIVVMPLILMLVGNQWFPRLDTAGSPEWGWAHRRACTGIVAVNFRDSFKQRRRGREVSGPHPRYTQRALPGHAGAGTDVLEALLTTRIAVAKAGTICIAGGLSVLYKGHHSIANIHYGWSASCAAAKG